jgi:hypothetical protein
MLDFVTDQMISEAVSQEFRRARRRALIRAAFRVLCHRRTTLLPFEAVRARLCITGQRDRGLQCVPLEQIIGSEGRSGEFDRQFLPLKQSTQQRWTRVGWAYATDVPLPPIALYQIGNVYFVRDGNHRVSVARQRGQIDIDAQVIELTTDVPVTEGLDDGELARRAAQSEFLRRTQLGVLRPGGALDVSELGAYRTLLQHIDGHRYFLGLERGRAVPYAEAVTSWYDRVYLPLAEAIDRGSTLRHFPTRTPADLYLWIVEHRHFLTEACGHDPGPDAAVCSYLTQSSRHGIRDRAWRWARGLFAQPRMAGACRGASR